MSEIPADTAAAEDTPAAATAPAAAETSEATAPLAVREPDPIDFDRAEFEEPKDEHVECGLCKRTIRTEYWQALGKVLCASCRDVMNRTAANANGGAAFGKALLLGGGVALGCGVGYAIFVGVTHFQFALVTIGIGWAIGTTIQKVTRGFGGRKHQILAVALTYFASTMSYFPGIIQEFISRADHPAQSGSAAAGAANAPSPAPAAPRLDEAPEKAPAAAAQPAKSSGPGLGLSLVILAAVSIALMLAAPLLTLSSGSAFGGLLGLLIIFFGLRTAWRISKGVQTTITGPHQVGAPDAA